VIKVVRHSFVCWNNSRLSIYVPIPRRPEEASLSGVATIYPEFG
jgi:hypothetical protein